jgi:hypothetical protein
MFGERGIPRIAYFGAVGARNSLFWGKQAVKVKYRIGTSCSAFNKI